MFHIALWEPEIPPNTGNIARLCAATGAALHLIGKRGFRLDDRALRRAGVDCWNDVVVREHDAFEPFEAWVKAQSLRLLCFSAHASIRYTQVAYQGSDVMVFGGESRGLPASVLERYAPSTLSIPQPTGKVRSLNLATAVGIALYEGLRQTQGW